MGIENQNIIKNKKETERVPDFIKKFSKENPDYRDRIEASIKTERKTFFENRSNAEKHVKKITEEIKKTEREIEKTTLEIKNLEQKLSKTPWYKFNIKHEIECLIDDLENGSLEIDYYDGLSFKKTELEYLTKRKHELLSELNTPYDLPESLLKKIDDFYESEKIRWKNQEFSAEDIEKYFSDEILEKLTLEEYLLLWERFPSAVQTHSIRQGIRDHVGKDSMGFTWHNIGKEKYFNNFKKILEDGYIKDTISVFLGDPVTKESVEGFLNEDSHNFTSKEARIEYLRKLCQPEGYMGDFKDRSAIHFGTNVVLDKFYGSESGNEVFVVYPSAYIASNYKFSGDLHDGFEHMEYNDNAVWPDNPNGISINSGIVFIPQNALVDKNNGSKYLLDENLNPILNNGELQLAQDPITSKDYWEKYFRENPESKPSKVFYYEGETGTEGLNSLGKVFDYENYFYQADEKKFGKLNDANFKSELNYSKMFSKNKNPKTEFYNKRKEDLEIILRELNILN